MCESGGGSVLRQSRVGRFIYRHEQDALERVSGGSKKGLLDTRIVLWHICRLGSKETQNQRREILPFWERFWFVSRRESRSEKQIGKEWKRREPKRTRKVEVEGAMEVESETKQSRFKRICVFCGSSQGKKSSYQVAAIELGKELVFYDSLLLYFFLCSMWVSLSDFWLLIT